MKRNFIQRALSNKKLRYGGYSTLLILAVLAVVIAVNVLVDQIPAKLDLTPDKLYSLSEQSVKIAKELKSDVVITMLAKVGQENMEVSETLQKYASLSGRIKLQTIDPERNPGWAKPYEKEGVSLSDGGVVIAGADGKRFKSLQYYDMYSWDTSDYSQEPQISGLAIEQKVTSAILYVTAERNPTIYTVKGHNEEALTDYAVAGSVENQNYEIKDLTLLGAASVPEDADIVALFNPTVDISAEDASKLSAYLAKGGRLLVISDPPSSPKAKFPNIDGLLAAYGVALQKLYVFEGTAENVLPDNPVYFMPKQESHDILAPIIKAQYPIVFRSSGGIETLAMKRRTVTVGPLLSTTLNSWGIPDYTSTTRTSLSKAPGDVEGPFTLAAAILDQPSDTKAKETRIVVIASTSFLRQELINAIPGNADFFLNSLAWLRNQKDTISIQPKSLMTYRLRLDGTQGLIIALITGIVIPLLVLGAGLFVWLRRRHR